MSNYRVFHVGSLPGPNGTGVENSATGRKVQGGSRIKDGDHLRFLSPSVVRFHRNFQKFFKMTSSGDPANATHLVGQGGGMAGDGMNPKDLKDFFDQKKILFMGPRLELTLDDQAFPAETQFEWEPQDTQESIKLSFDAPLLIFEKTAEQVEEFVNGTLIYTLADGSVRRIAVALVLPKEADLLKSGNGVMEDFKQQFRELIEAFVIDMYKKEDGVEVYPEIANLRQWVDQSFFQR